MAEAKENGNTLTIDGVAHDADSFSDEGKQLFVELSIIEEKLSYPTKGITKSLLT